jgi:hypothetical protein
MKRWGDNLLMLGRWLLRIFKSERDFFVSYERSHPRFFRYLVLDAVVSVLLVFAGFQFFGSHSYLAERLSHVGEVAMSSSQLVEHLKKDGITAYWLGPARGDEYTVDDEIKGIVDLMYLPLGTDPSKQKDFDLEIKTYASQKIWDAHTHTIRASANTQMIILSKKVSIRINPTSMRGVIATYTDRPEILAIAYPKPQSLKSMIDNVMSLKLIK